MTERASSSPLTLVALILGILAFGAALGHFYLGPIDPPPTLEDVVAEKAVAIRDSVVARLKGEEPETRSTPAWMKEMSRDDMLRNAIMAAAFLALVLASIGYIRREDGRIAASAVMFGTFAIAFQFLVIALGVLVLVILIAVVLGEIGFD